MHEESQDEKAYIIKGQHFSNSGGTLSWGGA